MNTDLRTLRAVAVDLDGTTLKNDSTMGERTVAALRACADRGIAVLIATGRSPVAAEPFRAAMGAVGPMVFYNGAAVVDVPAGRLLAGTLLDAEIAAGCAELAMRRGLHFHAFLPGDRLVHGGFRPEADAYQARTGLRGEAADLSSLFVPGGAGEGGCIKGMFIAEGAVLEEVRRELLDRYGGRIYAARSHATFLEVMAAGVSKGRALTVALELRGISPAETLAFGDAENDLPMAEAAGTFVATANAAEGVRRKARAVVASNEEEGPAAYLEALLRA